MNQVKKLSLAIALAGCGTGAIAAVEDPGHVQWGAVEVTPTAKAALGYDDNVFREGSGDLKDKGSTVYSLEAGAEFKAQKGLSTYALNVDALSKNFTSEQDANFVDFGLGANVHQEFNSRNRLDVDLAWGQYHDEGSTVGGSANMEAPKYNRTKAGLNYGFGSTEAMGRIDVFGSYDKNDYNSGEGNDRDTKEYGATAYYRFMPKTDVLLEIKQRNLDYGQINNAGYDITSYLVGLNWEATAKTTGYAKFGRRYRDSQVPNVDTEGYNGWEVGVSYMPVDRSVIQLSTSRDYGLESDNPSSADFTQGTTTTLDWKYDATAKITTDVFYTYTDEEVQNASGTAQKDRKINEFGASVNWKALRNATISMSYKNTDRDESKRASNASEDDYRRNVYMLTAEIAI
ncbi:hypothetical protein ACH42_02425 [Endozoicomonas sp. (ex Bugula neritina AB1)]|nr:hypothetical protein ACH42_02425 [Endozoicomonas sp. (ex Bugula neritina AB1)]